MENSLRNESTSNWQSKTVSSSSVAHADPHPSLNQMDRTVGQYLYPRIADGSISIPQGRSQGPAFPNTLSLGSYKHNRAEMGNSFLSFLSGSSSLLACNIQQTTNKKAGSMYPKLPIISSGVMSNKSAGSGVPPVQTGTNSNTLGIQRRRKRTVPGAVVASSAAVSTNCSGATCFPHELSDISLNFQIADKARKITYPIVPGTGKIRANSSSRGESVSTEPANVVNLHLPNFESSQKISTEKSTSTHCSSNFLSGCPRVLCLSICGDLLLSNTGLLGVVCSCHCLHMSISKFCEHSGLHNVNPGEAVHMDNGETIAQWRKLYFQKFEHQEHWMVIVL